ncbi:MAG: hypothetical protein ACFFDI_11765 [Promethearchaeota archaeon]
MSDFEPYTEVILELLLPIIDEKHKTYEDLFRNLQNFSEPFTSELITSVYTDVITNRQVLEQSAEQGIHLELLEQYSRQIVSLRFLEFVSSLKLTETEDLFSLTKRKALEALSAIKEAENLLAETLEKISTYQGLEWLIFAYNFLRNAFESYSSAKFVDGSLLNCLFAAMMSIHEAKTFRSFLDSVIKRNEDGYKISLKAFADVAKEIAETAKEIFASVGEEHINNEEEERLHTIIKQKRINDLETALKKQNYLLAINLSHQIIFDSSYIIHWGISLPQSYIRRQVEAKITEFMQGIEEIRKRGKWDCILPLYFFEKSLVSGSPPHIISAVNTSGVIMGILERDIKKPILSYF